MPKASSSQASKAKAKARSSTAAVAGPKASHLYTDDNPETTLHGTGFKDAATAHKTIGLVSKRSLTYQFQTINTMLYRAKGHPHKTATMLEAIEILKEWVDSYKTRKEALRTFKLSPKDKVERFLRMAEEYNENHETTDGDLVDLEFARVYTSLPPKKRLANTLVDPTRPGEEDWEVRRYNALLELLPRDGTLEGELWVDKEATRPTLLHLRCIMWAYSPAKKL